MELDGAGVAGAEGGASDALLLDGFGGVLVAAPLLTALVARVGFFFFTIVRSEEDWKSCGGGAITAKEGRRGRMRRCCGNRGGD
jgi:hypothetical protein